MFEKQVNALIIKTNDTKIIQKKLPIRQFRIQNCLLFTIVGGKLSGNSSNFANLPQQTISFHKLQYAKRITA
jgi:hypothetical protein